MMDDAALWLAFREGDNQALGLLAERYYRTLRRYGMKFMVGPAVVDDAVQDIFLDLWQRRHRINHTESVKFYLLKALRHHIIAYLRYHQKFTGESALDWDTSMPENFNAESLLIEQETLSDLTGELHRQLSRLPKREREALYLRYYEDLSVHEIAELMGVNRQSVSNFLQKALHKIRSKWLVSMVLYLFFL
ncbi:sigma-70 family RNA polymerase sigma factor [Dyadobacter sandarakinus]|uniref:Sigma-70 family RNA polymerase sigma factor n=2 Tax=Dyadobacter sandarakinus TaxID=2747268 RepID=A0ABX7IDG1_9BACT|nr:sigma-70 family RNA polymerase sigma factor [Dyadobacter sandarakinus]